MFLFALQITVDKQTNKIAEKVVLSFNGLGAPGFRPRDTERFLEGKEWTEPVLVEALRILGDEIAAKSTSRLPSHLKEFVTFCGSASSRRRCTRLTLHKTHHAKPLPERRIAAM